MVNGKLRMILNLEELKKHASYILKRTNLKKFLIWYTKTILWPTLTCFAVFSLDCHELYEFLQKCQNHPNPFLGTKSMNQLIIWWYKTYLKAQENVIQTKLLLGSLWFKKGNYYYHVLLLQNTIKSIQ